MIKRSYKNVSFKEFFKANIFGNKTKKPNLPKFNTISNSKKLQLDYLWVYGKFISQKLVWDGVISRKNSKMG